MALRVDKIPVFWRPFYKLISYLIALLLYLFTALIHFSCRIKHEGNENHNISENFIYALWHQSLACYFVVFIRHRGNHIWMNHPSWVMKPIHYWLGLSGVKELALGSAGNSGKEALQKVVLFLKKGYNTLITPDGPAGPPFEIKSGVMQMGLETGIPVIPLCIIPSKFFTLPTWDKKKVPFPFSTIKVIYGKPVLIVEKNLEEAKKSIREDLTEKK